VSRRAARLAAVEILYAADLRGVTPTELLDDPEAPEAPDPYTLHLVGAVDGRRAEIDELLGAAAREWSVERMSWVDRNVLRTAILELLEGEVPPAVVIDRGGDLAVAVEGARLQIADVEDHGGDEPRPGFPRRQAYERQQRHRDDARRQRDQGRGGERMEPELDDGVPPGKARGRQPPSSSRSRRRQEAGPQSIRNSSTCQQAIERGTPKKAEFTIFRILAVMPMSLDTMAAARSILESGDWSSSSSSR
jgi:transcription antitermination protein NusB